MAGTTAEELESSVAGEAEAQAVGDGPCQRDGGDGQEGGDGDCGSSHSICAETREPSGSRRDQAGAVAKLGIAPTSGRDEEREEEEQPVTMAVTPVRPPAATPAEDSM